MVSTVYRVGYFKEEIEDARVAERLSRRWGFRVTAVTRGDA